MIKNYRIANFRLIHAPIEIIIKIPKELRLKSIKIKRGMIMKWYR